MKKKIFLFICLANCVLAFATPSPSFSQNVYRWRNDNGSETTATWKASENLATTLDFLQNIRLRFNILNSAVTGNFNTNPLQYSKNGGAWFNITTATTNDFYLVNTANVANNTPTTHQMFFGYSSGFQAGAFKSDDSNNLISIASNTSTEIEYNIAPTANYDKTASYRFSLTGCAYYDVFPTLNPNPSYCATPKPTSPTTTSLITYNVGDTASPLTATTGEVGLLWFATEVGGSGSSVAPTPSTAAIGAASYWVASTNSMGCPGDRIQITVQVNSTTPATHLHFDGVNDYIEIPKTFTSDFTIEYWLKTAATGDTGSQWWNGNSIVDNEVPGINSDFGTSLNGNKLAFGIGNPDGVPDTTNFSTSNVNNGLWNHVAVTWSQTTGLMQLYINGVLESSTISNTNPRTASNLINIGKSNIPGKYFQGNINELRIWNTVKTLNEINLTKDCELLGNEASLNTYYKFNQGFDQSANGIVNIATNSAGSNMGTLHNFALSGAISNWLAGSTVTTGNTCTTLSNDSFAILSNLKIYPNPIQHLVNIDFANLTNAKLQVLDINGRILLNQELNNSSNTINTNSLPTGMYLFKVSSNEGTTTSKVIKN